VGGREFDDMEERESSVKVIDKDSPFKKRTRTRERRVFLFGDSEKCWLSPS